MPLKRMHVIVPVERPGHIPYCDVCKQEITVVWFRQKDGTQASFWKHGFPGKY